MASKHTHGDVKQKVIIMSDAVRDVISRSQITENAVILPPESLPRELYEEVNKCLQAAGGKWDRNSKSHLFSRDPRNTLAGATVKGEVVHIQQTLQSFYTPENLAHRVVDAAKICAGEKVLEPSAGEGALADIARSMGGIVTCIEIDEHAVGILKQKGHTVLQADFLTVNPPVVDAKFDKVIMNPPFTRGSAVKHVVHALQFLKRGGRIVAIMDRGVSSRNDSATIEFRKIVQCLGGEVEDIPSGAFKNSGTNVATVIVVIDIPM